MTSITHVGSDDQVEAVVILEELSTMFDSPLGAWDSRLCS